MSREIRIAAPPPKPLMVFDGDCNFCTLWIRRWRQITGEAVDYLPAQDPQVVQRFPEMPREQFQKSVQLIEPDGAVVSGAEAVFRALAKNPKWKWPLGIYERSPALAKVTECAYEFVAGHRTAFSFVTRLLWGKHVERSDYFLSRWIFLRALGAIYLVAFISFWTQSAGLIGHNGILPASQFMSAARQQCDAHGIGLERFHLLPTLCWFDSSDGFLDFQCAAGTVCAVLLIFGIAPMPCLALLWLLYLSLVTVGRDFYSFQWDNLLLEAGFLAIFFAPLQWLPKFSRESPPSRIVLWLLRLLLFKLMFSSGCVKLFSADSNWQNLTALTFHYQTQPLPTWPGWYANQLPLWFQKFSCAAMFRIELGAPWLIFFPRRLRFVGCAAIAFLQILILLTGNYTFFNFLTLALCVLLTDDFVLQKFLPMNFRPRFNDSTAQRFTRLKWPRAVILPFSAAMLLLSFFQLSLLSGQRSDWLHNGQPKPVDERLFISLCPMLPPPDGASNPLYRWSYDKLAGVDNWLSPFRTVNSYGLFAVMTTERREIIIEGSNDGTNWLPYEFKYKPGDVDRQPAFIEPFQPRLDWQMWFAALGSYQDNPWFGNFCERLLQGSPDVLALLEKNPFPKKPPRFIRAELYDYRFTNFAERRATGAWWQRKLIGEYLPPVSLPE